MDVLVEKRWELSPYMLFTSLAGRFCRQKNLQAPWLVADSFYNFITKMHLVFVIGRTQLIWFRKTKPFIKTVRCHKRGEFLLLFLIYSTFNNFSYHYARLSLLPLSLSVLVVSDPQLTIWYFILSFKVHIYRNSQF